MKEKTTISVATRHVHLALWFITSIMPMEKVLGNNNNDSIAFDVEKARITEVARKLARYFHTSICVEEGRWFPRAGDPEPKVKNLQRKRNAGFTFKLKQANLNDILNKITMIDSDYTWEHDELTGIINIYSKDNAPLERRIETLVIDDMSLREIFIINDLLGLRRQNITFDPGRGKLTWLDARVSLYAEDITVRKALNRLCNELNYKARWELFELPMDRGFDAVLMFHGYDTMPVFENESTCRGQDAGVSLEN